MFFNKSILRHIVYKLYSKWLNGAMRRILIIMGLVVVGAIFQLFLRLGSGQAIYSVPQAKAFQYAPLPSDNLLANPWFQSNCSPNQVGWQITPTDTWGGSEKTQNPTVVNCNGNWTGHSARFAKEAANDGNFHPNVSAFLSQVVGPVDASKKNLKFHALLVAHRVNQYKAEIFGSNSPNGPWNSVWVPFNIEDCLSNDCVNNSPPNGVCNSGNRECLWAEVSEYILGSANPIPNTIPTGYPYYKVEFVMNYPNPDPSKVTGDVGGKLARVYFAIDGVGGGDPGGDVAGDYNGDGRVDLADFLLVVGQYISEPFNIFDLNLVATNFGL